MLAAKPSNDTFCSSGFYLGWIKVLFKNIKVLACKCLEYLITEGGIKIWEGDSEDIFLCRRESVFQAGFLKAWSEDSKRSRTRIKLDLYEKYHLPRDTIQWLKAL